MNTSQQLFFWRDCVAYRGTRAVRLCEAKHGVIGFFVKGILIQRLLRNNPVVWVLFEFCAECFASCGRHCEPCGPSWLFFGGGGLSSCSFCNPFRRHDKTRRVISEWFSFCDKSSCSRISLLCHLCNVVASHRSRYKLVLWTSSNFRFVVLWNLAKINKFLREKHVTTIFPHRVTKWVAIFVWFPQIFVTKSTHTKDN